MGATGQNRRSQVLRRRDFIAAAAGGGVGGILAGSSPAVASSPAERIGTWVNGNIDRVEDSRTVWVTLAGRSSSTRIQLMSGTTPRKGGPAQLADFSPGEHVTAGGDWQGDTFHAEEFEELYELIDGVVRQLASKQIVTSSGVIRLTDSTIPRGGQALGHALEARPLDEIRRGDHVISMVRYEPKRRVHEGVFVGVVTG